MFLSNKRLFYIFLIIIIAIITVITALWIDLQWSIAIQVYNQKAGLNWFEITFYHNYTFIAAALFALLLINPITGHSDLWRFANSFQKLHLDLMVEGCLKVFCV
jgi:hypothetical protein